MRFVLDTHAFLWYVQDSPSLSDRAVALLEDVENEPTLSVVSLLEIAIKVSTGKLSIGAPMTSFVAETVEAIGIHLLPITPPHLDVLTTLPFHHRDPFDRLLIAQCLSEGLPLLGRDAVLDAYGIERLW